MIRSTCAVFSSGNILRNIATTSRVLGLDRNAGANEKYYRDHGILWTLFDNFVASFSVKARKLVAGKDHLGNVYYEVDKRYSARHGNQRGYTPGKLANNWDDIPTEWRAWLRGMRKAPPTQEEIDSNAAMAHLKKSRSDQIALSGAVAQHELEGATRTDAEVAQNVSNLPGIVDDTSSSERTDFPLYGEYEQIPGELYHHEKDDSGFSHTWEKHG